MLVSLEKIFHSPAGLVGFSYITGSIAVLAYIHVREHKRGAVAFSPIETIMLLLVVPILLAYKLTEAILLDFRDLIRRRRRPAV